MYKLKSVKVLSFLISIGILFSFITSLNAQTEEDQIIVRLKEDKTPDHFYTDMLANNDDDDVSNIEVKKSFEVNAPSGTLGSNTNSSVIKHIIVLQSQSLSTDKMISMVKDLETVDIAEPDFIITLDYTTPNDPDFSKLWGLHNSNGKDIKAPEAWDITTGSQDVVIGVIDTGVDYNHPDLKANAWVNSAELNGQSGVDDDNNGYIDDIYGIDAHNNDSNPMDDHYHGTHCAGTVGAVGDNGVGVVGVSWKTKIAACKFLSSSGSGYISNALECVNYFNKLKSDYNVNVVATSNSWGGGSASQTFKDALEVGGNLGVIFVAAAGNSAGNNDADPHYPSSYDSSNLIAVASTDSSDNLSSFSCYGINSVDLGAPGSSIYSTAPNNSYKTLSGTSMATPHVSGAAALAASQFPDDSIQVRINRILRSTDSLSSLSGKVATGGRLNAYKMLNFDQFSSPSNLKATILGTTSIKLDWVDNSNDETKFEVYKDGTLLTELSANTTIYTVTGLTANTTYAFKIGAKNGSTELGYSNEVSAKTLGDGSGIPVSEREALSALFNSTNGNSWIDKFGWGAEAGTECNWYGITCDSEKKHVTKIELKKNNLSGTLAKEVASLSELTILNLDNNQLTGLIPKELGNLTKLTVLRLISNKMTGGIPKELGNMSNLQEIVLSYNPLEGTIPAELGNLSNLKKIYFYKCKLTGSIPKELGDLSNLYILSIPYNQLDGNIPHELGNLTTLSFIYLHGNQLTGTIPPELGNLTKVYSFHLEHNQLTGSIPFSLGKLSNLGIEDNANDATSIDTDGDSIPDSFDNIGYLNLSYNQLSGSLPNELKNITTLKANGLNFTNNKLTADSSFDSWLNSYHTGGAANFRDTQTVDKEKPADPSSLTAAAQSSSSIKLAWSDNSDNEDGFKIYRDGAFVVQTAVNVINYTINNLSPNTTYAFKVSAINNIGESNVSNEANATTHEVQAGIPAAERAALLALFNSASGNSWSQKEGWGGAVETECGWYGVTCNSENNHVIKLNLKDNNLAGALPKELGDLKSLEILVLYGNYLTGSIPSELGNLSSLTTLELDNNQLSGVIPKELGNLTSLQYLWLNKNQLTGFIPKELGSLSNLKKLYLNENRLSGTIPTELGSLSNLEILYFQTNQLSGSIPSSLGNLTKLKHLTLYQNQLSGSIPSELGNMTSLTVLWLSNNQLSGSIPSELGQLSNLTNLYLFENQLSGSIPSTLGNLSNLGDLALFSNQLSGSIPSELGNLSNLKGLSLGKNKLNGNIPSSFANLSSLGSIDNETSSQNSYEDFKKDGVVTINLQKGFIGSESLDKIAYLDLSYNELSGALPESLKNITTFTNQGDLDLSYNGLTADSSFDTFLNDYHKGGLAGFKDTQALLNPPSHLTFSSVTKVSVTLNWKDNSDFETGFKIFRKTGNEDWTLIKTTESDITNYIDNGLKPNTTYIYMIKATDD